MLSFFVLFNSLICPVFRFTLHNVVVVLKNTWYSIQWWMFMLYRHHLHSQFRIYYLYFFIVMFTSLSQVSCSNSSTVTPSSEGESLLSPVGSISRPKSLNSSSLCSESTMSSISTLTSNYPKAPGFEREDQVHRLLSVASERMQCNTQYRAWHLSYHYHSFEVTFCLFLIHYLSCDSYFYTILHILLIGSYVF